MQLFKAERPEENGSVAEYWTMRFTHFGNTIEKVLARVDELPESEATKIAQDVRKQIIVESVLSEKHLITIPTLFALSEIYISHAQNSKSSWKRDIGLLYHIKRLLGDCKLSEITPQKLYEYIATRIKERSRKNGAPIAPSTVNKELACLRAMLNFAKDEGLFKGDNPVSKVKFLREDNMRKRILSIEEEDRLLEECPTPLFAIIKTALHTAMRKGEIVSLKWEDVDFENNYIFLKAKKTKSNKPREIEINPYLKKLLQNLKEKNGHGEFVFLNSTGRPYKYADAIKNPFYNACKRAGIKGLTFHDLRRTSATRMFESGVRIEVISEILGHSTIEMTKRYLSIDKCRRDALDLLAKNYEHE